MDHQRKKSQQAVPIGNIIKQILKSQRREKDVGLAQVWGLWERAVGEIIAGNARPAAFKGKILLVHVNSSPWLHQLQFLKKDIIEKINRALGEELVEEIKLKIGPVK
jgi:predicted nucleic acid-binding Zn ribbon protein